MKTHVKLEGCVGKTIQYAEVDGIYDAVLLSFTDDTYACVRAEADEDGVRLFNDEVSLMHDHWYSLIESGIATAQEVDAAKAEMRREAEMQEEAFERQEFERLRAKFEGK